VGAAETSGASVAPLSSVPAGVGFETILSGVPVAAGLSPVLPQAMHSAAAVNTMTSAKKSFIAVFEDLLSPESLNIFVTSLVS
jgi:hypothetical protein